VSSATIRQIAQTFLQAPPIVNLPEVRRGWDNQMQLIAQGITVPTQTIACLHIAEETEHRMAVPAVRGQTMVDYRMQLQVCMLLDGSGEEITDAVDTLAEDIKTRLRSDPRMGQAPDVVFESAQGHAPKILIRRGDVQYLNTGVANGTPIQWFFVEWVVSEQIVA